MGTDLRKELLELLDRHGFCHDALIAISSKCEAHLIENHKTAAAEEVIAISVISSFSFAIAMRIEKANESIPVHDYLESKIAPPMRSLLTERLYEKEALRVFISSYYETKEWFLKTSVEASDVPGLKN